MSVDREIDCRNCGNEMSLIGDINQVEQWIDGNCMKCGWTIYTTNTFMDLDQVNVWRKCQEGPLKQIDNQYLITNRFRDISLKEKVVELGYMKEEELDDFIKITEGTNVEWESIINKGFIDREYGQLKINQEDTKEWVLE